MVSGSVNLDLLSFGQCLAGVRLEDQASLCKAVEEGRLLLTINDHFLSPDFFAQVATSYLKEKPGSVGIFFVDPPNVSDSEVSSPVDSLRETLETLYRHGIIWGVACCFESCGKIPISRIFYQWHLLIGDFLGGIEKDLEVVIEKITKNPHLHADYVEKLLLPQLAMYRSEPFQTSLKRLMSVLEDFEAEFYPCTTAVSVSDYAASWARVYKKILSCEPLNRLIQADLPHLPCECIFLRQREEEFLQNHPKSRLEIDSYLKSREEIMGALPSGDVLRKFYFLFKRIMKNKEILKRNFSDVSVNLAFEDERSVRTGVERIFHEREIGARITGIDDLKAELNTEETEFLKLLSDTDRELVEAEYSERCSLVDEALAKYEKLLLQFPYSYYLRDKFNILKSKRRS